MTAALTNIVAKEKLTLPAGTLQLIVTNSEGAMRDALSLLDTISSLGATSTSEDVRMLLGLTTISAVQELVEAMISRNSGVIPQYFESQSEVGVDFSTLNKNVLEYLRLMMIYKVTNKPVTGGILDAKQTADLEVQASKVTSAQLLFIIRLFLRSYKEITQTPLPELPMLLAAVEASLYGVVASSPVNTPEAKPAVNIPNATTQVILAASMPLASKSFSVDGPTINTISIKTESVIQPTDIVATVEQFLETPLDSTDLTKEEVIAWWPQVVQHIKTINSPLATLLKNSPLHDVSDGKITIAVRYLFHKEHIENVKHTALISETITSVCGKRMIFKAKIVKDGPEPVVTHTVDALTDAIKIFGGELVE